MTPVTLWYRWACDAKGNCDWDFNHLEDGHCPDDHPTSKHPNHNHVWKGGKWSKKYVHLDNNNVVVHPTKEST